MGDVVREGGTLKAPARAHVSRWVLAPWKGRDVHKSRDEVLLDVERTRELDLPASVLLVDSPWQTGYVRRALRLDQPYIPWWRSCSAFGSNRRTLRGREESGRSVGDIQANPGLR